jgi:hypothetical protein
MVHPLSTKIKGSMLLLLLLLLMLVIGTKNDSISVVSQKSMAS